MCFVQSFVHRSFVHGSFVHRGALGEVCVFQRPRRVLLHPGVREHASSSSSRGWMRPVKNVCRRRQLRERGLGERDCFGRERCERLSLWAGEWGAAALSLSLSRFEEAANRKKKTKKKMRGKRRKKEPNPPQKVLFEGPGRLGRSFGTARMRTNGGRLPKAISPARERERERAVTGRVCVSASDDRFKKIARRSERQTPRQTP